MQKAVATLGSPKLVGLLEISMQLGYSLHTGPIGLEFFVSGSASADSAFPRSLKSAGMMPECGLQQEMRMCSI